MLERLSFLLRGLTLDPKIDLDWVILAISFSDSLSSS